MTDQELLDLNAHGFIPGPKESEEEFLTRVQRVKSALPKESIPKAHWEWPQLQLKELFDFAPHSLSAYYSNANLAPWQGAACWIGEGNIPQLQLRSGFKKGSYLKLYSRAEILTHESVHAARAAFDEPQFEEFFAYATASRQWRKVLGPLFQSTWEPWILYLSLGCGLFWEMGWAVAAAFLMAGFCRLIRRHRRLTRAFHQLMGKVKDKKRARAILFRLTDGEIKQLSQGKNLQEDQTPRWRLLRLYM